MEREEIYAQVTDSNPIEVVLTDGTNQLRRLDLKEIKILLDAAEVVNSIQYLVFEIQAPQKYLSQGRGSSPAVPIVRQTDTVAGDSLYNSFNHFINILTLDKQKNKAKDTPIKFRILKPDGTLLAYESVYLRFSARYDSTELHLPPFVSLPL